MLKNTLRFLLVQQLLALGLAQDDHDDHDHEDDHEEEHAFWGGIFHLEESHYNWISQKVDGHYGGEEELSTMKMAIIPVDEDHEEDLEEAVEEAEHLLGCTRKF